MQTPIIPTYPLPKGYTSSGQLLINRVLAGANIRYKETFTPAVTTRIKEELRVIRRTHTCDYFLLWSDIAKFCKEHDILTTPGRGSAANSIVNYCLGITHVDPMKSNPVAPMLFSRFFNESRSLPRIDMDVEPDAVDQIYTFIDEVIGHTYTSYRDPKEHRDNSKLKIDILGMRVLKQIHDLEDVHHCHLDWNTIPLNDEKTLQLFHEGNTDDILFFDTILVQNALRQIHRVNFWELVAVFTINRPMQGSMELYIQCANSGLPYEPMLYQEQAMVATSKAWQDISYDEDFKHLLPFAHAYCQTLVAYRLAYLKTNYMTKEPLIISTGFPELDNALGGGFKQSELTLIGGRPAIGKTSLILSMINNLSIDHQYPMLIYALGMSKNQIGRKIAWLCIDDTPQLDITEICERTRAFVKVNGMSIVFVDYLQLIGNGEAHNVETIQSKKIDSILSTLKSVAQALNVPLVVLCQMNRNVHPNPQHIPQMEDIREVSSWESVDNVLLLHRPGYYDNIDDQSEITSMEDAKIYIPRLGGANMQDVPSIEIQFNEKCCSFIDNYKK